MFRRLLATSAILALLGGAAHAQQAPAAVTGTVASATQSATFMPAPNLLFNVTITGAWVGTCQLKRTVNAVFVPITVSAGGATTVMGTYVGNVSEQVVEAKYGTKYELDCGATAVGGGWTSGTLTYRFEQ